MINGCEVAVAFSGDVVRALALVAEELEKLGYHRKKQGAEELEMSFKGKWLTSDPAKVRHSVWVAPAKGGLSFKFGTGLVASYWTDADERWAQGRADDIVAAIRPRLHEDG